jgi:hypothetical protein
MWCVWIGHSLLNEQPARYGVVVSDAGDPEAALIDHVTTPAIAWHGEKGGYDLL